MLVTVYAKANCAACDMTKKELLKRGVSYEERQIDVNPIYLEEVKEMGFASAPVVVTKNDKWSGFRPDKIKAI